MGGVLFTNFLVWFIATSMSILSIYAKDLLKPEVELLVGIAMCPLNALVNPFIYKPDTSRKRISIVSKFTRKRTTR